MISKLGKQMNYVKIFFILALSSFFFIWLYSHSLALAGEKEYPNKPIKIIIPYEPSGIVDLSIRIMADRLTRELKVPMILENRVGANGMLGATMVLKANADGYTLLGASDAPIITGPIQTPNPTYDPFKDFSPICNYGVSPVVIWVYNSSPYKTLSDLVKDAKKNPGKLTCGVPSSVGPLRLGFEVFKKEAGVDIKILPLKGAGQVATALLGKHIEVGSLTYVAALPFVKSGEARILASTVSIPGSSYPTFVDAGYSEPKIQMWTGFFVSSKMPKQIYEKLIHSFERVAKHPELGKKWEAIGLIPDYKNPIEFTNYLKEEWPIVSKLVDELGLKQ